MYVKLKYSDGAYGIYAVQEEKPEDFDSNGEWVWVEPPAVKAWEAHEQMARVFHNMWAGLEADRDSQRRIQELEERLEKMEGDR